MKEEKLIIHPKRPKGDDGYKTFSVRISLPLRRRLLYPFNYGNKCRIFGLFISFGYGKPYL